MRESNQVIGNARGVAIQLLKNTISSGNGGYQADFGPLLYSKLVKLAFGEEENYCNTHGHIRHDILNMCICCGGLRLW